MKRVWVVYTILPESKTKVVCTIKDEHFALAMPDEHGGYKGVAYFDTDHDAWAWIKELLKLNPNLNRLGPFQVEQWLGYDTSEPRNELPN